MTASLKFLSLCNLVSRYSLGATPNPTELLRVYCYDLFPSSELLSHVDPDLRIQALTQCSECIDLFEGMGTQYVEEMGLLVSDSVQQWTTVSHYRLRLVTELKGFDCQVLAKVFKEDSTDVIWAPAKRLLNVLVNHVSYVL